MSASFPTNDRGDRPAAPINSLRRFTEKRVPARANTQVEHCELCSEVIPADHRHLLDLSSRALACSCQACSLLFSGKDAGKKYRLVPRRYLLITDFHMLDQQWDELMIPVNMAFIFHSLPLRATERQLEAAASLSLGIRNSGSKNVMAFYPSPAGATESLLGLEGWETLLNNNTILRDLEPDVEALLINRVENAREHYIVPIDACYQLVGLIRMSWKGLSGGVEAREAITSFFDEIRAKSQPVKGDRDA